MHLMKITASPFHRRALALAVGTILGVASQTTLGADSLNRAYVEAQAQPVEVFVRLSADSVSELNIKSLRSGAGFASPAAQKAQAARVDAEQAAIRGALAAYGATELSSQRVGANGLRISVPANQVDSIKLLPGVQSVGRVVTHTIDNATSVPWIGAPAVTASTGASGQNIRIAVIDTGIDYTHANFGGSGVVADYTGNNKNVVEAGTFPTAKVVGGFDFAGPTYSASAGAADPTPDPDPDPLDGNGHGSHVAGSAAGFGVPASGLGAGVAPSALLYALKVFSDASGSTNLTSLAIEWAMDPDADGDMSDHLDVINMSLGSPFGEPADPSAISAQNAADLGIIVVASAGNEGDLPYVTGAPAVAPGAISVAANTPGNRNFATVNILTPPSIAGFKFNEEGTSPTRVSSVAPLTDTVVEAVPLFACTALTNAAEVNGNIVLLQRGGGCTFQVKMANALAAGARAAIAFNNVAGDPIVMGAITAPIAGVMVSLADGTAIAAQATTDAASPVTATLGFGPDATKQDRIAVFSSRGPGSSGSSFKPDLAAPGVGIISTGVGTGTGTRTLQGTSMAAPHVAGAAALMRQLNPEVQPYTIKALLQNSTVDSNASGDTDLARQGVGAVRVDRAAALSSFALPGGVSFGHVNPIGPVTRTQTIYLENMRAGSRTFTVTHVPHTALPGVTVTCPGSQVLTSFGRRNATMRLRVDPAAMAAAGIFDNASVSQREVDGWCVFSDGTDTLRVGYLAVVDPASNFVANPGSGSFGVDIRNNGPAIGFAEGFTLVGSGGVPNADSYGGIAQVGARRGDPAFFGGLDVIEFGISVNQRYEAVSNLDVDVFLDTDGNGTEDTRLVARDWTSLSATGILGTYVTAQFIVGGGGFLDWIVSGWDFNDRALVLPFTLTSSDGLVSDSFSYRLVLTDRQGNSATQTGTVNLANEIVPDLNSFGLAAGDSVHINVSGGSGDMLWLFPNNREFYQDATVFTTPGGF
jgi:minor extracellular serine protease Vpr